MNFKKPPILALDVGEKRVGLAISDPQGRMALPLHAVERAKGRGEREILELIASEEIETLVVGLPLSADDQAGAQAERVRKFVRRLERRADRPLKIEFVDEHLSTFEAKQRLQVGESPSRKLREKGVIDALSASIILQEFLDLAQKG